MEQEDLLSPVFCPVFFLLLILPLAIWALFWGISTQGKIAAKICFVGFGESWSNSPIPESRQIHPKKPSLPGFCELFSLGPSFIAFLIVSADGN